MNTSFQKTTASDEWYTPVSLVDALGPFDTDPCAPMKPLWKLADVEYNKEDNGLTKQWFGRVWCNPPYSQPLLTQFCEKMVAHHDGILLTFARVDNRLFQGLLLPYCDAILFLRHRIRFYRPGGTKGDSPGNGSCLIAFGKKNVEALRNSGLEGFLMERGGAWNKI